MERELPGVTDELFRAQARAEAARVWDLYQAGVIREPYFHAERDSAVLILECADVPEARRILATLPFVQGRLIDFELVPLRPYPGFARLFR